LNMATPKAQAEIARLEQLRARLAELYTVEADSNVDKEKQKIADEIAKIVEERYR
jgi:hypothetical protein